METGNDGSINSVELVELREAQERLAAAKRKLELAEQKRLKKTAADLAAYRAAEEKRIFEQQEARERIEAQHAKRQREQAEAEERERQAKRAEERALEMRLNLEQENARKKAEHEAELRKIEDAALLAEQEAQRSKAQLARASAQPVHEEQPENIRAKMFSRLSGLPTENPVVREVPSGVEPRATVMPEVYAVRNGRIDQRVFETRFGAQNRGVFFISPSTGELVLNGYRWALADAVNPRVFQHSCEVYIALVPNGYELRRVGTSDRVGATPLAPVEGLIFEPLPETAVDKDELILSEVSA